MIVGGFSLCHNLNMSKFYSHYNANPEHKRVGDCVVRALSVALDQPWEDTYVDLANEGLLLNDMPTANHVWGAYLHSLGFRREFIPDEALHKYTVDDFCRDHPIGTFILALSGHVVPVINGNFYDSWDSGQEIPIYYWVKEV